MRLVDLEPNWFDARYWEDGNEKIGRSGFTMLCPHCGTERLAVTTRKLKMTDQMLALSEAHPNNGGNIVPGGYVWSIDSDDFADMTVTPSVDASASGHWHGFITNGEIR
ncbi:MAG: hypothetical protein QG616_689 [Pseudomonadota bacterium]|jgi:hypothetical protein|nr:hypothetical protein [Pseudomonadota bacterium]MDQ5907130.1 hypothetical protein [Pseudomonadota bacterium]MDQ5945768.1 hypothetical protein [Pseudomonadota bacterium]